MVMSMSVIYTIDMSSNHYSGEYHRVHLFDDPN